MARGNHRRGRHAVAGAVVHGHLEEEAARALDARGPEKRPRREVHDEVAARVQVAQHLADAVVRGRAIDDVGQLPGNVALRDRAVHVEDDRRQRRVPNVQEGAHAQAGARAAADGVAQLISPVAQQQARAEEAEQPRRRRRRRALAKARWLERCCRVQRVRTHVPCLAVDGDRHRCGRVERLEDNEEVGRAQAAVVVTDDDHIERAARIQLRREKAGSQHAAIGQRHEKTGGSHVVLAGARTQARHGGHDATNEAA